MGAIGLVGQIERPAAVGGGPVRMKMTSAFVRFDLSAPPKPTIYICMYDATENLPETLPEVEEQGDCNSM